MLQSISLTLPLPAVIVIRFIFGAKPEVVGMRVKEEIPMISNKI
jgi:hypothetical protein